MRKRFMATILTLCMVITLLPTMAFAETVVASGTCGDNVTWTLTDDGTMTFSGTGEMDDYDNFDGSNPDVWSPGIRSKVLKVIINQGVTSIGVDSFRNFMSLKEVSLPNSLKQIGKTAFSGCSALERIELPISVENIAPQAFAYCDHLSYVKISSNKTTMGDLNWPELLDNIFISCPLLKTAGPIGSGCNIEFAWKDEIPDQAFEGCQSLESIIFPSGVQRIGDNAFNQCMALKSVVIPESVTEIGHSAFGLCKSLTKVVIPKNASFGGTSGGFAFSFCESLITAGPIGSGCNIEYGWTDTIPENAFRACESLAAITIPVSITSIERGAFQQTGIKEIYYMGSKEQWQAVNYVGAAVLLDPMPTAKIYYNGVRPAPSVPVAPPVQTGPSTVVTANLSALAAIAPASGKAPLVLAAPETGGALSGQVNASTGEIAFQGQLESGNKLFFLEPDTYIPLARPSVLP